MVCRKQVGFGQKMPTGPPRMIVIPPYMIPVPISLYSAPYGKQSGVSIDQPSQHTYGVKSLYEQGEMGCNGLNRRYNCEIGYWFHLAHMLAGKRTLRQASSEIRKNLPSRFFRI